MAGTPTAVQVPMELEKMTAQLIVGDKWPFTRRSIDGSFTEYFFGGKGAKSGVQIDEGRYVPAGSSKASSAMDCLSVCPPCRFDAINGFTRECIGAGHLPAIMQTLQFFIARKHAYIRGSTRGGSLQLSARVEARLVLLFNVMLLAFVHHDLEPSDRNAGAVYEILYPVTVRQLTDPWFCVQDVTHSFWILLYFCREHKSLCAPCYKCTTLVMPGEGTVKYLTNEGYAAYIAAKRASGSGVHFMTMVEFSTLQGNQRFKATKQPAVKKPFSQDNHLSMFLRGAEFGEDFCIPV